VSGEFIPDKDGRLDELRRLSDETGRYTPGFRHYENFYAYKLKNPEATIEDYTTDMNSQISFEEFLKLTKTAYLHEVKTNPVLYYEMGLDDTTEDDMEDDEAY
jgi:hypothetical protein